MEEGHSLGALASLVDVPDYAPQYAKDNWRNYTKDCDGDPNRFTAYGQCIECSKTEGGAYCGNCSADMLSKIYYVGEKNNLPNVGANAPALASKCR